MPLFIFLATLLCFLNISYSSATYCVCKDGVGDSAYQKALDYACGSGADCSAILQGGPCFQPNTLKSHCDYAANSYYQKKGQVTGSCDFSGSAIVSPSPPTTVVSGCTYPASPSLGGSSSTTPTGTPAVTGTPTTTGTPTSTGTSNTTIGTPSTTTSGGVYSTTTGTAPSIFSDPNSQDFVHCSLFVSLSLLFASLIVLGLDS